MASKADLFLYLHVKDQLSTFNVISCVFGPCNHKLMRTRSHFPTCRMALKFPFTLTRDSPLRISWLVLMEFLLMILKDRSYSYFHLRDILQISVQIRNSVNFNACK